MLLAHKLIDALKSRQVYGPYYPPDSKEVSESLADSILKAEKFDFGHLALEKGDVGYFAPNLSLDEKEFWVRGFLPLPSDANWYECWIGDTWRGLLVGEDKGIWQVVVTERNIGFNDFCVMGFGSIDRKQEKWTDDNWDITTGSLAGSEGSLASLTTISIYLTLMLNSRSTEIRTENAPARLNKSRLAKGQTPLFSHRVVDIVPWRYAQSAKTSGTHASPRLHWRRSHLRWFDHPTANSKEINGRWATLIPRQIVGLAENGIVTHEYRVRKRAA